MNAIQATRALNQRELENAVPPSASWHADYRDTAYVYIGGLPLDLSEGDIITIFSQFGNPTHLNLVREKETGKSRGFAFLKYEDQRSCDLAVDNLGGAEIFGRTLRVDHSRYKRKDGEDEDTWRIERLEAADGAASNTDADAGRNGGSDDEEGGRRRKKRKVLKEERELEEMLAIKQNGEDEDPMRDYLIREKREEVDRAREKEKDRARRPKHKHRHHHRDQDIEKNPDLRDRGDEKVSSRHKDREDRPKEHSSRRRHRVKDEDSDDEYRSRGSGNRERDNRESDRHRHERDR